MHLAEVAAHLGLSVSRVQQYEQRALRKLRQAIAHDSEFAAALAEDGFKVTPPPPVVASVRGVASDAEKAEWRRRHAEGESIKSIARSARRVYRTVKHAVRGAV